MSAGFIQLERWRVLLLCRACEERSVHPVLAGGMVRAGLGGPHSTDSIVVEERLVQAISSQTLPHWGYAPLGVGSSQVLVGQKQLSC